LTLFEQGRVKVTVMVLAFGFLRMALAHAFMYILNGIVIDSTSGVFFLSMDSLSLLAGFRSARWASCPVARRGIGERTRTTRGYLLNLNPLSPGVGALTPRALASMAGVGFLMPRLLATRSAGVILLNLRFSLGKMAGGVLRL
jgi:hypothetical protein